MIVEIKGQITIDLDEASGSGSIEGDFTAAIEDTAMQWGMIRTNEIEVLVIGEADDPEPESSEDEA